MREPQAVSPWWNLFRTDGARREGIPGATVESDSEAGALPAGKTRRGPYVGRLKGMVKDQTSNAKDIVIPLTMAGGLLTIAFFTGSLWTRVAYVEATETSIVSTMKQLADTVQQMRIEDERFRAQVQAKIDRNPKAVPSG